MPTSKPTSSDLTLQEFTVKPEHRAKIKNQEPLCIWFTGLSGSGKSTLANAIDKELHKQGLHTALLDGDNIRLGLSSDLGFSAEDRSENLRRVAEVCKLMVDAGLIVIAAFISPLETERSFAKSLFKEGQFIEIHMSTPLDVCEQRDPKGLYKKARQGILKCFTGIDGAYESPVRPDLRINAAVQSQDQNIEQVMNFITRLLQWGA